MPLLSRNTAVLSCRKFSKKKMGGLSVFWLIIVFVSTIGCDVSNNGSKFKDKNSANQLTFIDSSNGLPRSSPWRNGLGFYDINDDGYLDIFAPPPRKAPEKYEKPLVWYGSEKGDWTESQLNIPSDMDYDYGAIAVSDFDGDKIPDIALAMHCLGLRFLKGVGQGRYVNAGGFPSMAEFSPKEVVADDFNNDGILDLAALSESQFNNKMAAESGVWLMVNSDNKWTYGPIAGKKGVPGFFGYKLATGDVNGDGNRDIAVGSSVTWIDKIIWLGDGKGGFTLFNEGLPKKRIYYSVALADINNDGRDDLIGSVTAMSRKGFIGLKTFISGPDGFEDASEGLPSKEWFSAVNACDLDGDGSVEIIGGTGAGGLKIFARKGNRWEETVVSGLPNEGLKQIWNLYCKDVNKDGYKDIVINYGSDALGTGGISVFLNGTPKLSKGQRKN